MAKKKWQKAPEYLDDIAKEEWNRQIKVLLEEGHDFSEKDVKALEGYCISYSKFRKANKILAENGFTMTGVNKNGSTYEMQRPEVTIAKNSEDEMRNWMKELGFSPASRARMGKNKKIANSSSVDKDLEDMIS